MLFRSLPGLGPRSARRAALDLLKKRDTLLKPLAEALDVAAERIVACATCGNLDTVNPCTVCADARRDPAAICVVDRARTSSVPSAPSLFAGIAATALALLAKTPVPGRVKTRLSPPLSPEEAASFARACLTATVESLVPAARAPWTLFLDGEIGRAHV